MKQTKNVNCLPSFDSNFLGCFVLFSVNSTAVIQMLVNDKVSLHTTFSVREQMWSHP